MYTVLNPVLCFLRWIFVKSCPQDLTVWHHQRGSRRGREFRAVILDRYETVFMYSKTRQVLWHKSFSSVFSFYASCLCFMLLLLLLLLLWFLIVLQTNNEARNWNLWLVLWTHQLSGMCSESQQPAWKFEPSFYLISHNFLSSNMFRQIEIWSKKKRWIRSEPQAC